MNNSNNKAFLSTQTFAKQLVPVFVTLIAVIAVLLLPINETSKSGIVLLIAIFGGLLSIAAAFKVRDSLKNLNYLKNNGYFEQMCQETPDKFDDYYAVTDTFVFSRDRNLCLPIEHIHRVEPHISDYVNNVFKSKIELTVYMDNYSNYDKYCLLLMTGPITKNKKSALVRCITALVAKNPDIIVDK